MDTISSDKLQCVICQSLSYPRLCEWNIYTGVRLAARRETIQSDRRSAVACGGYGQCVTVRDSEI